MGIFIRFFGGAFGGVGRFYFYRYCLQFHKSSPQRLCPLIVGAVANMLILMPELKLELKLELLQSSFRRYSLGDIFWVSASGKSEPVKGQDVAKKSSRSKRKTAAQGAVSHIGVVLRAKVQSLPFEIHSRTETK